jgi:hypothetical protein
MLLLKPSPLLGLIARPNPGEIYASFNPTGTTAEPPDGITVSSTAYKS